MCEEQSTTTQCRARKKRKRVKLLIFAQKFLTMAKIKIYSDIVDDECKAFMSWAGLHGMSFTDIDRFIDSIPEGDNAIHMTINCRGGMTDQALAMYDALRATGKEISAEVIGECSSSATLLLLAAKKELRKAHPNASILIHNPYISGYVEGDSKRVGAIADTLEDVRNKFLDIYVERTGSSRETLEALMDEDRPINVAKAIELGFIHEEILPISAQNKIKTSNEKMSIKSRLDNAIKAFREAFSTYSMTLETADGKTLELEKESGEPVVGDAVLSEDGEYLMPDGRTIVVEESVISEIRPAEEVDAEGRGEETEEPDAGEESEEAAEIDRLKAEIAEKDKEIEELRKELDEAKSNAKSNSDRNILNMVAVAGGIEWLKGVQSNGKIDKRTTESSNLNKAQAKKAAPLTFSEYRKQKAEKN